jgi:hypothetical protein
MGVHQASLFKYKEFIKEALWLVEQVEQGNYGPLRDRTCEAVRRLQQEWPISDLGWIKYEDDTEKSVLTQEWPLLNHGEAGLLAEEEVRNLSNPAPHDIGYWFLVVLSEYLQSCPSPLGNWSVLSTVLESLGWKQDDRDLLFRGFPTSRLLRPKLGEGSPWPLKDSDPYWLWLHPGRARSGWLPTEDIDRLHNKLYRMEDRIKNFDVSLIPNIDANNPIVVRDYKVYLQSGYRDTISMLSTAQKLNRGLFMSITLP